MSLSRLRGNKRVGAVHGETGDYFVELAPGWAWSEQTSFGGETVKELLELVRQSVYEPEEIERRLTEEIEYKDSLKKDQNS